ncbi:hypothetical protein ACQP1W_24630 [Spirillospora sp. CA-255316]
MTLYVKFTQLECVAQNEPYGDEPYLKWKESGRTIWGRTPDNEGKVGQVWNLQEDLGGNLKPIPLFLVTSSSVIELWEYDPDTNDDFLGFSEIPNAVTAEKAYTLRGDDAEYKLTYKVVDV